MLEKFRDSFTAVRCWPVHDQFLGTVTFLKGKCCIIEDLSIAYPSIHILSDCEWNKKKKLELRLYIVVVVEIRRTHGQYSK